MDLNAGYLAPVALVAVGTLAAHVRRTLLAAVIAAVTVGAVVHSVVGFAQHWHGGWPPVVARWAGGPFLSSMHLGAALAMGAAATLGWTASARKRHVRGGPAAGLVVFTGLALLLVFTRTRAACAALAVAGAALAGLGGVGRGGRVMAVAGVFAFFALCVAYSPLRGRMREAIPGSVTDLGDAHPERSQTAGALLQDLPNCWLLGANAARRQEGVRLDIPGNPRHRWTASYCTPLNQAWTWGVPAALAWQAFVIVALIRGIRSKSATVLAAASGGLCLWLAGWVIPATGYWPLHFAESAIAGLVFLDTDESGRRRSGDSRANDSLIVQ
jgi:hypothetical protein